MEAMLADAPAGPAEALISVLCVEATPKAQETLERAMQSSSSSSPAVALQTLRQMPGTRLRVSPYTTVHVLRGFLSSQEAGPTSSAAGGRASNEKNGASRGALANAQFFAVRAPDSADVVQGEGEKDDETLVALPDSATLQEVLSCGHALQLPAEATEAGTAPPEMTLVLLYARESQYGDLLDECIHALIFGFCASIGAWLARMCIRKTTETVHKQKQKMNEKAQQEQQKQREQQQFQQQQQQQQRQQQQQQNFDPSLPPPVPGYGPNCPPGMPPPQQPPYFQGPASPNGYGAPPSPYLPPPPSHQQQPANGYPIIQPPVYAYNAAPPPACTAPEASSLPCPPPAAAPCSPGSTSSPHGLPPAKYPFSISECRKEDEHNNKGGLTLIAEPAAPGNAAPRFDSPPCKTAATEASDFDNPSCHPPKLPEANTGNSGGIGGGDGSAGRHVEVPPQYGSLRANDDAPAWSWSPINTTGESAKWSPASAQADGTEGRQ
jgi:type II secretory pathway pseudopilin PulG